MYKMIFTPRFGDIDGLRHINNCVIPMWFETARNELFKIFNPDFSMETWNLIMCRTEFDFLAQMRLTPEVEVRTAVLHIGNSSFSVMQEAWQYGKCCVRGKAVIVHFDFAAQKSIPIPEYARERLREHLLCEGAVELPQ